MRVGVFTFIPVLVIFALSGSAAYAQTDAFLLIDDGLLTRRVRVAGINAGAVSFLDQVGDIGSLAVDDCIALIRREARWERFARPHLLLADGRRLPGTAAEGGSTSAEALAWKHAWLGRIEVPIDDIRALVLRPGETAPSAHAEDVIILANGDRLEGIITALGDPITIEIGGPDAARAIDVPLDRIAAAATLNPPRAASGRRISLMMAPFLTCGN